MAGYSVNVTFLAFQTPSTLFHVRQQSLIGDIISKIYSNLILQLYGISQFIVSNH